MDSRSKRRVTAAILLLLLPVGLGCGELNDVTGLWRTLDQPLVLADSAALTPCLDGAYVQLVVGQYGAEVAGVIKFFDSPQFATERCPCSFLYSGRMKSGRVTFDFEQPGDGEDEVWLRAVLDITSGEEPLLGGDVFLVVDGEYERYGGLTLNGQPRQDLPDELKRCDPGREGAWNSTLEGPDAGGSDDVQEGGDA